MSFLTGVLQDVASSVGRRAAIRQATKDPFVKEVFAWAQTLAEQGAWEGYFNITEFCKKYPDYVFDGTMARKLLESQDFHIIGRIQKECRQHPKQMKINWMLPSMYDYFYNDCPRP